MKNAFTLAEVLVTLGIIGVVAAMTLPVLINQSKGKELQIAFLKAYSTLQNTLQRMSSEEGQIINAANYPNNTFMSVFKKYLLVAKDCGSFNCISGDVVSGEAHRISKNYFTYNNSTLQINYLDDGQILINDGMLIAVENLGSDVLYISVDVNGNKKKPNRWGHDLFTFQVMDDGKLLPMGAEGTTFSAQTYCSLNSSNKINGIGCTHKALTNKNYFQNLPK